MRLVFLAAITILTTNIAVTSAQSHAQITGTIKDDTAAVVQDTRVEALNLATWQITTGMSNSTGE